MPRLRACLSIFLCLSPACGGEDQAQTKPGFVQEQLDAGGDLGISGQADMSSGTLDMSGVVVPDIAAPAVPRAIETTLDAPTIQAGQVVQVGCLLVDEAGQAFEGAGTEEASFRVITAGADLEAQDPDQTLWQATLVGTKSFSCASNSLGLIDPTPAFLEVTPGAPATVVTTLDARTIRAGQAVAASCEVFDAWGNQVEGAPATLSLDRGGAGISVSGLGATIERAGDYLASCEVAATTGKGAPLEVVPDVPAVISGGVAPMVAWAIGEVVAFDASVEDRFGNVIPDPQIIYTAPEGQAFGAGRFRFDQEGAFELKACVLGPTYEDRVLCASASVVVNGQGPQLSCEFPAPGAQLVRSPGQVVMLQGRVFDTNGVATVRVGGQAVTPGIDGRFFAPVTARYGINFVDLTAVDTFGEENSLTCAFATSQNWLPEGSELGDTITLKLRQPAVDDRARTADINSLGDLTHEVLNSQGTKDAIDAGLSAANPLSDSCLQNTFLGCAVSARTTYLSSRLAGPNDTTIDLITDGLELAALVRNTSIRLRVQGRALGINYNVVATGTFDLVEVELSSDLSLSAGRPNVALRGAPKATVSGISVRVDNVNRLITSALTSLFRGRIRGIVERQLESLLSAQFNAVLDGVVSNLDVSSLGTRFDVPKLGGPGVVSMDVGVSFSSLGVSRSRALFGLGLGLSGSASRPGTTLGSPYPVGPVKLDPPTAKPVGVGIHTALLNQALHVLWRGGFFQGALGGGVLGDGLPADVSAMLEVGMQPFLISKGSGEIEVHLGEVSLDLVYPGLFDQPLRVELGVTADGKVGLQGGALEFRDLVINEFYFSTPEVPLGETTRDVLEGLLRDVVQNVLQRSLNGALPSLPIPSFGLPASLAGFGLPGGSSLGLTSPQFDTSARHILLQGDLGIR